MIVQDKKELEVKCSPVSVKEGEEIGVRLLHELRESENGIGLAANQIGIDKRVCVVNVKEPLVLINPKIVEKSKEKFVFPEGCLSFPEIRGDITRAEEIRVKYQDLDGVHHTIECDGLLARCIQHEVDHLKGILFIDRMDRDVYEEIKKEVQNLKQDTIRNMKTGRGN